MELNKKSQQILLKYGYTKQLLQHELCSKVPPCSRGHEKNEQIKK